MADLERHADGEDWLKWAIEFMRRGIWPEDVITVHGPHGPGADFMWGEMGDYNFQTARRIRGIRDVRGVRIWAEVRGSRQDFPLLPASQLEPKARCWLRTAERTLASLREKRKREAAEDTGYKARVMKRIRDENTR